MQEMRVRFLGQEYLLEEDAATHSSILAWRIPWTEEPGGATVHAAAKSWTQLSVHAQKEGKEEREEGLYLFNPTGMDKIYSLPQMNIRLCKKKKKIVSKNKEKKKNKQTKKAVLLIQPKQLREATASSRRSARTPGGTSAWGAGSRVPPAEGREEQRAK